MPGRAGGRRLRPELHPRPGSGPQRRGIRAGGRLEGSGKHPAGRVCAQLPLGLRVSPAPSPGFPCYRALRRELLRCGNRCRRQDDDADLAVVRGHHDRVNVAADVKVLCGMDPSLSAPALSHVSGEHWHPFSWTPQFVNPLRSLSSSLVNICKNSRMIVSQNIAKVIHLNSNAQTA